VPTMVVFRCTQKLRHRMGSSAATEDPSAKSSTRLGDWYANAISVHRQHVVLAVSGVTLLPVLVPAAPYKTMMARFVEATGEILRAVGIPEAKVAEELGAMRAVVVAPTNDRRVLGSLNDFAFMAEGYTEHFDGLSLRDVALKLAEAPCSPLGMNNPRDATRVLFSVPMLRLVKDR
jgi:hypothetical protein